MSLGMIWLYLFVAIKLYRAKLVFSSVVWPLHLAFALYDLAEKEIRQQELARNLRLAGEIKEGK
jgi:hypothetical protein